MKQPITELDRLVVQMASFVQQHSDVDLYPISVESVVFLAREKQGNGGAQWRVVSALDWSYSAFARVCVDRATLAETGQLLPNGQRVKAEAYIKLWREAFKNAISFSQMLDRGISLVSTISHPTRFLKRVRGGQEDYPRARPYLDSPHIVKADDAGETTWAIPLDRLDALQEHAALSRIYCRSEDEVDSPTPNTFTLRETAMGNTSAASMNLPLGMGKSLSLFEVAA